MPASSMQTMVGDEPMPSLVNAGPSQLIVTIAGENPQTHTLTKQSLTIGRLEGNDIIIPSQLVSRNYARLEKVNGGYKVSMSSEAKNPILVEGRELSGSRMLHHGDILRIGSLDPGMMVTMTYNAPSEAPQDVEKDIVFGEKTLIQIGRDATNDVVLAKSYQPYGEVMSSAGSGASPFAYTGEAQDASGLVRARYYASGDGRFFTRDMWMMDENDPMSYNAWGYIEQFG